MRKIKMITVLAAALAAGWAAAAEPTYESVQACHEKAQASKDPNQVAACLADELKIVQAEHKDAVERVAVIAKRWDKKTNSRQRWNKLIQAGQSFDAFVRRECEFVRMTTKGNQVKEKNAELACRINYYRMRTDVLETRYLAAEKH